MTPAALPDLPPALLHRRAGSQHLTEIHGNRTWLRCMDCGARRPRDGFSMVDLPPRCPQCEGIVKSDTVMFGEPIPADVLQESQPLQLHQSVMAGIGLGLIHRQF